MIVGTNDFGEIFALLYRYARGVDTRDWDTYRSVFTEDAQIDYTSAGAIAGTREEVIGWLAAGFATIPWSMHYITNIEADITGDTATVRAMFYNPMQLPGMTEPKRVYQKVRAAAKPGPLDDDFSLIALTFP